MNMPSWLAALPLLVGIPIAQSGGGPSPRGSQPVLYVGLAHGPFTHGLSWSPDGRILATWRADLAVLWDAHTGLPRATFVHPRGSIDGVAWDPSGATFGTAGRESVALWDAHTGRQARMLPGAAGAVAWSPEGQWV